MKRFRLIFLMSVLVVTALSQSRTYADNVTPCHIRCDDGRTANYSASKAVCLQLCQSFCGKPCRWNDAQSVNEEPTAPTEPTSPSSPTDAPAAPEL